MKKILIAGGSGLVGQSLSEAFLHQGDDVNWLSRNQQENRYKSYYWNPETNEIDKNSFHSQDVLIQLAGCSIGDKPWSNQRKKEIVNSRIQAIQTIYNHLKTEHIRIPQIIQVSAIGYYGDREDENLSENASPGKHGFLAEVCKEWEQEAMRLQEFTDHFCIIRIGLYLSTKGGIWPKMIQTTPFHLLNYFGSGKQYYSWIHFEDFNRAVSFLIDKQLDGIFNMTAPNPIANKAFMNQIKNQFTKWMLLIGIPQFVLKLILGEQIELLMTSAYVLPTGLQAQGFQFKFESSEKAIKNLLKEG
ncbi:MAG: TIGR01777 family oxidoreductase [Saprospiraceae bacterium]